MSCENKKYDNPIERIYRELDDINLKLSVISAIIGGKNCEKVVKKELPPVLNTAIMAKELGNISIDSVRRIINASDSTKRLPASKCGRGYFIGREAFIRWRSDVYLQKDD